VHATQGQAGRRRGHYSEARTSVEKHRRELLHIRMSAALVRSGESSHSEESGVIGTLLILWLGLVPAIWLVWALSRVPALLLSLTARVRKTARYS
jgi:hypothetical protein